MSEKTSHTNPLIHELEVLQKDFEKTTNKLIKDVQRQEKIMARSDKRQKQEYDELQQKLEEVTKLQLAQKELLDSFVKLIAGAIDAKSTYTGGHCKRVPEICMMLADAASQADYPPFDNYTLETEDDKRELSIAAWLHDCGKVTTPEYVVDKATKLETLYNRIHEVRTRFEVIHRDITIQALQKQLNGESKESVNAWLCVEHEALQAEFDIVAQANLGAEFMDDNAKASIESIANRTWVRHFDDTIGLAHEERNRVLQEATTTPQIEKLLADKTRHIIARENFDHEKYQRMGFKTKVPEHLYNLGEVYNLLVSRGTLSYEERFKIQEHVHMTIEMLEQLPFPDYLKNVPLYAGAHHETLVGSGYPRQLTLEDMPISSRIMAVADVFEALTASDRPYKDPKTLSQSIKILGFMAKDKHIDMDVFKLFLRSGVYLEYAEKFLKPEQIDSVDLTQYI
jgi:HD-GYP domain-containing protein (c-di-GMP phosphodiesterase class II)